MRCTRRKLTSVALGLVLALSQADAGEIIVHEFKPGAQPGREVLGHVAVKGLVAEFLDPEDTGLGKSLGYLLWREILTAISDQAGAGVILARPPGGERLTDLLKRDYHRAALEISEQQNARMLLWGAVNVAENRVYIASYLTLIPQAIGADLGLTLNIEGNGFSAVNPRTRFNFRPIKTTRDALFRRTVVARTDVWPRREPRTDASRTDVVNAGTALRTVNMVGPWFEVELPGGKRGYVNQSDVAVPPLRVTADATVNVRAGPGTDHARRYRIESGQSFEVVDMRYRPGHGTWYRIERDGVPGWVASWVVRPHYSIPAAMFIAGLYRYQSDNFPEAVRSFESFLKSTESAESNVNRAAAYQMLGAAQLLSEKSSGLDALNKAVALTPYDPAAYNFRILGELAARSVPSAIDDLRRSLDLDRFNPQTYALLDSLNRMFSPSNPQLRTLRRAGYFDARDVDRLDALALEFADSRRILATLPD
jgi:uncharacterized protein YgiM (DUF1202 family)